MAGRWRVLWVCQCSQGGTSDTRLYAFQSPGDKWVASLSPPRVPRASARTLRVHKPAAKPSFCRCPPLTLGLLPVCAVRAVAYRRSVLSSRSCKGMSRAQGALGRSLRVYRSGARAHTEWSPLRACPGSPFMKFPAPRRNCLAQTRFAVGMPGSDAISN